MLVDITRFFLNNFFTLFGAVLILRAWLQFKMISIYDSIPKGVFRITDWIVNPIQKILPIKINPYLIDIITTLIVSFIYVSLIVFISNNISSHFFYIIILSSILVAIKWTLSLIVWIIIFIMLLSWINPCSPFILFFNQLINPLVNPLRKIIPSIGRIDIPLFLFFISIQFILIIISRVIISILSYSI